MQTDLKKASDNMLSCKQTKQKQHNSPRTGTNSNLVTAGGRCVLELLCGCSCLYAAAPLVLISVMRLTWDQITAALWLFGEVPAVF